MRNQRPKGRSLHGHESDAATTRPKYSQRPSPVSQTSGAGIIDTFLASICKLKRSSLDDARSELVAAILEVVFVTDKLHRRGDNATDGNRAERQAGDVDARAAAAVIYHFQREVQPRNSSRNVENRARSGSISVDHRKR